MSPSTVNDRSTVCPHCNTRNVLIGSDLGINTLVSCSRCGRSIGIYADLKPVVHAGDTAEQPSSHVAQ